MPPTLGNIAFQALSFGILGAYCWMIHNFGVQAAECLKSAVVFPRISAAERAGTGNSQMYTRFQGVAMTLGLLSVGVAAVKVASWLLMYEGAASVNLRWGTARFAGAGALADMASRWAPAAVVAVALAVMCVAVTGTGVLKAVGSLTLSQRFTDEIIRTKKNWMAALSTILVPLAAVWTGVNPVRDRVVAYLALLVVIVLAVLFVVHTLRGFIKQKVSLLVWFLYLCVLEIFPVCALVLAVVKNV